MKIPCSDIVSNPSHQHFSDIFPKITQDPYGSYNIENREEAKNLPPPMICEAQLNPLKDRSLRDRQFNALYSLDQPILNHRQVSLEQIDSEEEQVHLQEPSEFYNDADPISEVQRQHVLDILYQRMQMIENVGESSLFSQEQQAAIKNMTAILLVRIFRITQDIGSASTLQSTCRLLNTLNSEITPRLASLQNIIFPPLAAEFENQSQSIWIDIELLIQEFQEMGLIQPASAPSKKRVLIYLQELISETTRFKTLNSENLSAEFIQKLQMGLEVRKNYISQALQDIWNTNSHKEIYTILSNLRLTIMHHTRERQFRPILESLQRRHLEDSVLNISSELFIMQKKLGEPMF